MKEVYAPYFEAKLYIGSNTHYNGEVFSEHDLIRAISAFQEENTSKINDALVPVRITPTRYVCGDYAESGWEVAIINYPRSPRDPSELYEFIKNLTTHLLEKFKQNRISIVIPPYYLDEKPDPRDGLPCIERTSILMFQADDAEESHMEDNPLKPHKVN